MIRRTKERITKAILYLTSRFLLNREQKESLALLMREYDDFCGYLDEQCKQNCKDDIPKIIDQQEFATMVMKKKETVKWKETIHEAIAQCRQAGISDLTIKLVIMP